MRYSKGGITLEMCDNLHQSEYENHMAIIEKVDEEKQKHVKELAQKGLPGILLGLLIYGEG